MKRCMLLVVVVLYFFLGGCDKNSSPVKAPNVDYIGFNHSDCLHSDGSLAKMNDSYLHDWQYENGMLNLTIYYWANCCPVFHDSVRITDNRLDLYIRDEGLGCWCICDYYAYFNFFYPDGGDTHILFHLNDIGAGGYETIIDTVITVQ